MVIFVIVVSFFLFGCHGGGCNRGGLCVFVILSVGSGCG